MAKMKMRKPIVLPASGASQASINSATDEIKEVVYKSVGGLDVELNKAASATANGTLVIEPSDGKDVMEKATVTVAIPLEDNKASTIDVSQYASAVEVTPSDGKTAMKKTTVTLSNIPQIEANKEASITQNGTVEVTPTDGKDGMAKATVTVAVPSADIESNKAATIDVSEYTEPVEVTPTSGKDGMAKATVTLSNIPSGGDLEDNKTATINVSEYTQPVEITPTAGKDGMRKVTVSLSNMPAGANMLYAWVSMPYPTERLVTYSPYSTAPANLTEYNNLPTIVPNYYDEDGISVRFITKIDYQAVNFSYTKVSDTEFKVQVSDRSSEITYTRDATKDIEVWNVPPEVETTKQATIDVSTYDPSNKPVITPTAGKQSMGSVEVTLSNIPSGGSATAYAWNNGNTPVYYSFDEAPASLENQKALSVEIGGGVRVYSHILNEGDTYTKINDNEFTISTSRGDVFTYTRNTAYDFTLWQVNE